MNIRLLVTAAVAALTIGSATQAAVVGPHSGAQRAAETLDLTQSIRRICRTQLKCDRFPCRFQQVCYVTKDYPPEHGNRR